MGAGSQDLHERTGGWLSRNWKGIVRIGAFAAGVVALLRLFIMLPELFPRSFNECNMTVREGDGRVIFSRTTTEKVIIQE